MAKNDFGKIAMYAVVIYVVYTLATGGSIIPTSAPAAPVADSDTPMACDSTTTPLMDALCRDIENKGTTVTCTFNYIRNGDGVIQTDTDGLDVALNPGDSIEYFVNSTGWYGVHGTFKVPCEEEPRMTVLMKDYATTPTMQFFSEDDGLLMAADGSSNTELYSAEDTPALEFKYYSNTEDYIQDALFFCQFDKTYVDEILLNDAKGSESIPVHFSYSSDSEYDGTSGAWSLGDIVGTTAQTATITVDTSTTSAAINNVSCYLDDQDWYIDEDTGSFEYGPSDENNADIGQVYNALAGFVENISLDIT